MLRLCGDSELELSMLEGRSGLHAICKLEAESEGSEMVCDTVEDMDRSSSSFVYQIVFLTDLIYRLVTHQKWHLS
jgi:hypothetical protein